MLFEVIFLYRNYFFEPGFGFDFNFMSSLDPALLKRHIRQPNLPLFVYLLFVFKILYLLRIRTRSLLTDPDLNVQIILDPNRNGSKTFC